jgi:RsiW-degrading membrane proteinase PrsW (M82 family)
MTIALERPIAAAPVVQPLPRAVASKRTSRPGRGLRVTTRITLGISSVIWLFGMLMLAVSAGAPGFALSLGLAVLPVPVVLAAFRWIDRAEPEPARLLLVAFMWGATTATAASVLVESFVGGPLWLSAGTVEEIAKGFILVALVRFVRSEFDGVIDGIVYSGFVAAGFAFTENVGYYIKAYTLGLTADPTAQAVPGDYHTGDLLINFVMRGVILPFSHPLFTVMFGIGLGLGVTSAKRAVRIIAPVIGLAVAMALHMTWDYVLFSGPAPSVLLGFLGISAVLFFAMIIVVSRIRRRELRSIGAHLQSYADQGWLAQSELPALSTFKARRHARRWAASVGGKQGKRAMVDVQHSATKLGLLHRKLAAGRTVPDFASRQRDLLVKLAGARMVLALSQSFETGAAASNQLADQMR